MVIVNPFAPRPPPCAPPLPQPLQPASSCSCCSPERSQAQAVVQVYSRDLCGKVLQCMHAYMDTPRGMLSPSLLHACMHVQAVVR